MGIINALIIGAIILLIAGSYLDDVTLTEWGMTILGGIWTAIIYLFWAIIGIAIVVFIANLILDYKGFSQ